MVPIRRILFPTDFSEYANHAWSYVLTFAKEFAAEVYLLHVVPPPPRLTETYAVNFDPDALLEAQRAEATASLDRQLRGAKEAGLTAQVAIRVGVDYHEILEYARAQAVDLIIMGTHGRTGLAHVLLGSVAEKVVRRAPCPVLTIKHPSMAATPP
jgi:universal stress protein A